MARKKSGSPEEGAQDRGGLKEGRFGKSFKKNVYQKHRKKHYLMNEKTWLIRRSRWASNKRARELVAHAGKNAGGGGETAWSVRTKKRLAYL